MALSHLALDTDRYEIYLDNKSGEDQLEQNEESTASSFNTIFNSSFDLSPLLYLKSTSGELALNQFTVDDLPLTTTKREHISLKITLPDDIAWCNQAFNIERLKDENNTIHEIEVGDFTTSENQILVDRLNKKINFTLLYLKTILKFIFDSDVFKDNINLFEAELTSLDAKILMRYLDCTIFSRHIVHRSLASLLDIADESLDHVISFPSNAEMTIQSENQALKKSQILKPVTSRTVMVEGKTIDLTQFGGVNLRAAYTLESGSKLRIETELIRLFTSTEMIRRTTPNDHNTPLTDESRVELTRYFNANKKLTMQALSLKALATFLHHNSDLHTVSSLFNNRIVALSLVGGSRLKVIVNNSLFLPSDGTSIALHFPKQLSYVLGCEDNSTLDIGPISNVNNGNPNLPPPPKLANHITKSGQCLYSAMRPMPRLLYVCSDIISTVTRNMWLRDTPYESCRIIYTHVMDETNLTTRFISKNTDTLSFHRISSLHSLWNSFSVYILDQNLRKVVFPLRTYAKIGLIIRPTNHGD